MDALSKNPNDFLMSYMYSDFPRTSLVAQMVKHLPTMRDTQVPSLGWEDPLKKEMATQCSMIIPWTEEPERLRSMSSKELDMTEQLSLHFKTTQEM